MKNCGFWIYFYLWHETYIIFYLSLSKISNISSMSVSEGFLCTPLFRGRIFHSQTCNYWEQSIVFYICNLIPFIVECYLIFNYLLRKTIFFFSVDLLSSQWMKFLCLAISDFFLTEITRWHSSLKIGQKIFNWKCEFYL